MTITVTRENLFYIGAAKQSVWGTAVAPTWYYRWLDGTEANPVIKEEKEREGDGGVYVNLMYKGSQYWQAKIKEKVRPQMVGYALQALLGSSSDTYTAPTKSTTLAASITAGATTFQSTGDLGNVGTLAVNFSPGYSSSTYEVQTVNLVSRTGAGPYTYTLASSATFANAHSNSDAITSASTHAFVRGLTTYDPYTIEVAFYQAGFGKAFRLQDCVCTEIRFTGTRGKTLEIEHTWYGIQGAIQASLQSPTFESAAPFLYRHASGTWSLDSATTGNATSITTLNVTLKNSTNPDDLLSEGLSPAYFIPGNIDIDGSVELHFQNYNQFLNTYYGSSSATTGAVDSATQGFGAIAATWTLDAVNSLALSLPNVGYTGAPIKPKLDGKPLMQQLAWTAVKSVAQPTPFSMTVTNSLNSAY